MKQTERTITVIEYESDDGKVKSNDKKVVEKYEAQKDPIQPIAYIEVSKLSGVQTEDIYKIETREDFIKLKNQFNTTIHGNYLSDCLYYILDFVEMDYDYYELINLESFYKELKDRVEEDKQSIEINEQALWEVNSLKENLADISKKQEENS